MKPLKTIFGALSLVFAISVAAPGYAQTPSKGARATASEEIASDEIAQTVAGALESYFAQDSEAAKVFRAAKIDYKRLLIAHLLPSKDRLLVEVELAHGRSALRYPLRLEDISSAEDGSIWRVDWAPDPAYARALAGAAKKGAFARSSAGQSWSKIQRLPAFPVLVGADFFVTPYGRIEVELAAAGSGQSAGLDPPKDLSKHAQRWTGMLLQDDPGTANVDILLSEDVSWKRATQALLPAAMVGLARVYFISMGDDAPVAFPAVAPVFKEMISGESTLVIGVSSLKLNEDAGGYGVGLRMGSRGLEASSEKQTECPEKTTFCVSSEDEFAASLHTRVQEFAAANMAPSSVMLAASGDIPAEVVLKFLARARKLMKLPTGKIVVGYIAPQS